MIWLGLALGIVAGFFAWNLSSISENSHPHRSGLSPYLFIFIYTLSVQVDFLSFFQMGYGVLARSIVRASDVDLGIAMVHHNAILLAAILGILVGESLARPKSMDTREIKTKLVSLFFITVTLLFSIPIIISIIRGDNIFELGIESHLTENRDPVNFLYAIVLVPLLALWLTKARLPLATIVCTSLAVIMIGTGSRTRVLYILICYFFYLSWYSGVFIRRYHVLIATVLLVVIASAGLNYRQAMKESGSIASVARLFDASEVLRTSDFPMSEAGVWVVQRPVKLQPYPFEEFVGAALAPIPRTIVPFKPDDGSAQFTRTYDSKNYYRYGRGLTVGSIIELKTGYGFYGAAILSALLGLSFGIFCRRSRNRKDAGGFVIALGLYLALYNFLRNDIQNTGQILVVFAFVGIFFTKRTTARPDEAISPSLPRSSAARSRRLSGAQRNIH